MRAPAFLVACVCATGACLCTSGRAECQTGGPPEPLGSAIFGGARARGLSEPDHRLDLMLQTFGGYDDDVLADQSGRAPRPRDTLASTAAGPAVGTSAALSYSRPGLLFKRPGALGDFSAWAESSLRYYPRLDNLTGVYHRVGLSMSAPLNRRISLYASPYADYTPRYSFQPVIDSMRTTPEGAEAAFPAGASRPLIDYSVVANGSVRYGAGAGARFSVGPRSLVGLEAGYVRRRSDLAVYDMELRRIGGNFEHQFTGTASLNLGYEYQERGNGSGLGSHVHNLDVGVDYKKPLSRSRKTFVRFTTGSTIAESETTGSRVYAIGSASLVHHVQRTWTALVEYHRRLQYVDGFERPLYGDMFTTGVSGLLSRRMELVVRGTYTSGAVGLSARAPQYDSYYASARLRRAISRRLAGYVEALFYRYDFDEAAPRPPGLPPRFDRLAFRCGLSIWVPLAH
jgi:hypothetical protein